MEDDLNEKLLGNNPSDSKEEKTKSEREKQKSLGKLLEFINRNRSCLESITTGWGPVRIFFTIMFPLNIGLFIMAFF